MATTALTDVFDVSTIISGSSVRQLQEQFEVLPGRESNIVKAIGYGSAVKVSDNMKHEWIVDEYFSHTVTVNEAAGYADSDTAITVDDASAVQVGQTVKIGDETARVTGVNYGTEVLTVSRSIGSSAAEAIVDNQVLYLMTPSYLDDDTFPQSTSLRGEFLFNYPKQIMHSFSETAMSSARHNYLTKGATELAYSEQKHMVEMDRLLAMDCFYGEKVQPTGSVQGGFDGLDALITNNVNTSVGLLTLTKLVNLLELIWADSGNLSGVEVWMEHDTKRVFDAVLNSGFSRVGEPMTNAVGVVVDRFTWNGGTLDFVIDHYVQPGHAFFINPSHADILPLDVQIPGVGAGWNSATRSVTDNNALKITNLYWGIFTFLLREQRMHGKMKGITTTLSSYPGAV